jgi:hypothetical protein
MPSSTGDSALNGGILDQLEEASHVVIMEIISALKSIRYGSLEIVIHNSKIVQIEKKEKFRIGQGTSKGGR